MTEYLGNIVRWHTYRLATLHVRKLCTKNWSASADKTIYSGAHFNHEDLLRNLTPLNHTKAVIWIPSHYSFNYPPPKTKLPQTTTIARIFTRWTNDTSYTPWLHILSIVMYQSATYWSLLIQPMREHQENNCMRSVVRRVQIVEPSLLLRLG
jgi:hypothetical protein